MRLLAAIQSELRDPFADPVMVQAVEISRKDARAIERFLLRRKGLEKQGVGE